jgi:hypothetical protein
LAASNVSHPRSGINRGALGGGKAIASAATASSGVTHKWYHVPAARRLSKTCSDKFCAPGRTRTYDPLIRSQLL